MARISTKTPISIDPRCVYPWRRFQIGFGISPTRVREAKKADVTAITLDVGHRKFIRGSDAIAYLEQLAQLSDRESKNSDEQ